MARISKDPAIRRQELIDIAQTLFISKGYEATSVRDILNEVGGAPGMFYYYFSSKEEIYKAAMTQYIDKYVAKINFILSDQSFSIPERIHKLLFLIRTTFAEYLSVSNSHFYSENPDSNVMVSMKVLNLVSDSVKDFIDEAIGRELVKNSAIQLQNVKQLALFILYGIYGVLHDGSENGLSIKLIDRNMESIIPFISNTLDIPVELLMNGGE